MQELGMWRRIGRPWGIEGEWVPGAPCVSHNHSHNVLSQTRFVIGAVVASLAVAGCGERDRAPSPSGIPHPNENNRSPSDASPITQDSIPPGLSEERTTSWIAAKDRLLSATTVFRVGSERRGPELFGYIPKAELAANGNLVVLDETAQEVRIFDPDGNFIEQFGGMGEGPMELRGANDFHIFPDGRIAVPLGEWGPIKIFQRSRRRWELSEIIQPGRSSSLCGMRDGRWFSAAYASSGGTTIIKEFGDSIRSFGSGYKHEKWFIRRTLSGGSVACLDKSDRIVYGFEILPLVHSYTTEGTLQWTAAILEDYLQLRVMEYRHPETGQVGYSESVTKEHDRLMAVYPVGLGDQVLLGYSRVLPKHKDVVPRYYLLDAESGAGAYLGDDVLPAIVSMQPDGYIALFAEASVYLEVRRTPKSGASEVRWGVP